MSIYIGLDVGTTTITAAAVDIDTRGLLAVRTAENDTEVTPPADRRSGRSEWDIEKMAHSATEVLSRLAEDLRYMRPDALGITGQQHGMVLLDADGEPISPFIGWQDRRCLEPMNDGITYLQRIIELAGDALETTGCRPATGYMGPTLFWLKHSDELPNGARACFAPDYIVSCLCGTLPVTDPTNAAGSGLYDVFEGDWSDQLLNALGLSRDHLLVVADPCARAGRLTEDAAGRTGLPSGLPLSVACGDNQASFAGSVAQCDRSLLINIGTGGQISARITDLKYGNGLELRPYLDDSYLLVGAGVAGGRSYRALADFFNEVAEGLCARAALPEVYQMLNDLAAQVPAGSDGVRCEPFFAGTRQRPDARANWTGLTENTLTPGHLARSLLEGLAGQLWLMYGTMQRLGAGDHDFVVGSGNAIRNNALLQRIVSDRFGLPLRVPAHREEAAVGAALVAAVAQNAFPNIRAATDSFVSYDTTVS